MSGLFHRVDFCSALSSSMGSALMSDGLSASRASGALSRVGRLTQKIGALPCVRELCRRGAKSFDDSIFHHMSTRLPAW